MLEFIRSEIIPQAAQEQIHHSYTRSTCATLLQHSRLFGRTNTLYCCWPGLHTLSGTPGTFGTLAEKLSQGRGADE